MSTLPTVSLIAPAPYWTGQCKSGNTYTADSLGRISAASNDVQDLLNSGCYYSNSKHGSYTTPGAPAAAGATLTVSSASLTAGATLSIGVQPDVPRQLAAIVNTQANTATLTAGILTLNYLANDGTTQTDVLNFGALDQAGPMTLTTSKGVLHVNSAIVGATVTPATNQTIQIGTNNAIAVPLDPGAVNLSWLKETKLTPTVGSLGLMVPSDETVGTLTTTAGLITPTTVPDGTHWLSFEYLYQWP